MGGLLVAVTDSKKKTTTKSASKKSTKDSALSGLKKRLSSLNKRRTWLAASLILNALLVVGLLLSVSNPTSFTDASSGYTINIPAVWARQDEHEVFRITKGAVEDPRAQIFAYGQRNATLGFYDSPKEDRDATLDQVTQQINEGQNQFILPRFELSDYQFTAQRGQRSDGTEYIQSHFTAVNAAGEQVEGEHLLLITMGGGVYSLVAFADASYWPQISGQIAEVMSAFTAP